MKKMAIEKDSNVIQEVDPDSEVDHSSGKNSGPVHPVVPELDNLEKEKSEKKPPVHHSMPVKSAELAPEYQDKDKCNKSLNNQNSKSLAQAICERKKSQKSLANEPKKIS